MGEAMNEVTVVLRDGTEFRADADSFCWLTNVVRLYKWTAEGPPTVVAEFPTAEVITACVFVREPQPSILPAIPPPKNLLETSTCP
jgi:hypothetical protein